MNMVFSLCFVWTPVPLRAFIVFTEVNIQEKKKQPTICSYLVKNKILNRVFYCHLLLSLDSFK